MIALFFLAAPTAGNIGSCGSEPHDLDAGKFFLAKKAIDCDKCVACGIVTKACERACDLPPSLTSFPVGCYPLVHDGEVCLDALEATGCNEYRGYMADKGPSVPTECSFCPPKTPDAGALDAAGDGGEGGSGGAAADSPGEP